MQRRWQQNLLDLVKAVVTLQEWLSGEVGTTSQLVNGRWGNKDYGNRPFLQTFCFFRKSFSLEKKETSWMVTGGKVLGPGKCFDVTEFWTHSNADGHKVSEKRLPMHCLGRAHGTFWERGRCWLVLLGSSRALIDCGKSNQVIEYLWELNRCAG